ncbi:pectate lyase family protein [Peristeroidobacter soli]|jgi:hypothetical protein|uniref:pectate lyase family protein n=1 Tax=Peristeroidobacter soli TaxID=2497877 RepID=UPI00101D6C08|nr:pectate lyase [Peristeroidobacter soli]
MTEQSQNVSNRHPAAARAVRFWLLAAATIASGVASFNAGAVSVIPGAKTSGINTPAGRGGTVVRVTNLNADGAGSLKACVDQSGPRVCVFEVSGTIPLTGDLHLRNPNITIAGQTAPSPGITLRGAGVQITTSNVLIQHIRVRPGDDAGGEPAINRDGLKIEGPAGTTISNIVIDHCTFTWSIDEVASAWQNWNNISLINNIFAEPLHQSIHPEGNHGFGVLLGPVNGNVTLAGNLLASMQSRLPMTASTRTAIVNNVIYNWGNTATDLQSHGAVTQNSVVGNVYLRGPDTAGSQPPIGLRADASTLRSGAKVFLADNLAAESTANDDWSAAGTIYGSLTLANFKSTSPVAWPAGLTTMPTSNNVVKNYVLKFAGARPADRDAVDSRIIEGVRNSTNRIINCVAPNGTARCERNGGGYPTLAENHRALTLPADPNTVTASGYTNLEVWLHGLAAEVEGRSPRTPASPTLANR